jgi:uncharacterized protein YdcH (DUF465 family)
MCLFLIEKIKFKNQPEWLFFSIPKLHFLINHNTGRLPMFERHQDELEKLRSENAEFRRIYNRHQELDKRVTAAETGAAPMGDMALMQMKKEKLWAKDQLARMMPD